MIGLLKFAIADQYRNLRQACSYWLQHWAIKKRIAEQCDALPDPNTEEGQDKGAALLDLIEASEMEFDIVRTTHVIRRARRLGIGISPSEEPELFRRAPYDIDPGQPYYLTPTGFQVVLGSIRDAQKARRETVAFWVAVVTGLVGAVTGLVAVLNK